MSGNKTSGDKWPNAGDYSNAMQLPAQAIFKGKQLRQATINRDANRQPKVASGRFANVYSATLKDKSKLAVRVFTSYRSQVRDRYHVISEHLERHAHLPFLVGFRYVEKGINVIGGVYPLVTMDWVEGTSIYNWTHEKCLKMQKSQLRAGADQWMELIIGLRKAEIAHGDLQHDNILVTAKDEFKLVDYDGMCVPALANELNIECGLPPYQHPKRDMNTQLSLSLDNFSALFIFVALRALAADPELWKKYVFDPASGNLLNDNLLFSAADFEDYAASRHSPLYSDLMLSPDAEVKLFTEALFKASVGQLDAVPTIADLLKPPFDYDEIQGLIQQKKFEVVEKRLAKKGDWSDAPNALKPKIEKALEILSRYKELQEILARFKSPSSEDSDSQLQQFWSRHQSLFNGWTQAASCRPAVKQANDRLETLRQMQSAAKALRPTRGSERKIRDLALSLPKGYVFQLAQRAQLAGRRVTSAEAVEKLVNRSGQEEDLVAESKKLQQMMGHSLLAPRTLQKVKLAEQRLAAWSRVQPLVDDAAKATEQNDTQLVAAWDEKLFDDWERSQHERGKLNGARKRLDLLKQLRLGTRPPRLSLQGEQDIIVLAAAFPADYEYKLRHRVEQAEQRLAANQRFTDAIAGNSEQEIVDAHGAVRDADALPLIDQQALDRVKQAEDRVKGWKLFSAVLPEPLGQRRDERLIRLWKDKLFQGWDRAEAERYQLNDAKQNRELIKQIEKACKLATPTITLQGEAEIVELTRALPDGYSFVRKTRVDQAERRLRAHERLQDAVDGISEQEILDAWQELKKLKAQGLADKAWEQRAELADERLQAWVAFQGARADDVPSQASDVELVNCWNETLFQDWEEAEDARLEFDEAGERLQIIKQMAEIENSSAQLSLSEEAELAYEATRLPPDYQYDLRTRVDQAEQRTQVCDQLRNALSREIAQEIAEAWEEVERVGAKHLVVSKDQEHVAKAEARLAAWARVQGVLDVYESNQHCDQQLVDNWDTTLFRRWPEIDSHRRLFSEARTRLAELDKIERAAGKGPSATTVDLERRLVKAGTNLPSGYEYDLRPRVEQARHRLNAWQVFGRALQGSSERAIVEAWHGIQKAAGESLVKPPQAARVTLAEKRVTIWVDLAPTLRQPPCEERDRQLVRLWDESVVRGWDQAERERQKFTDAEKRVKALEELAQTADQLGQDLTAAEQKIVRLSRPLSIANYEHAYQDRVEQAHKRLQAKTGLMNALKGTSEEAICAAWSEVQRAQAETLITPKDHARVKLAQDRRRAWSQFAPVVRQKPAEDRDRRLTRLWKEPLFHHWDQAELKRPKYKDAKRLVAVLDELAELQRRYARKSTVDGETKIAALGKRLPPRYQYKASARVARANGMIDARRRLLRALKEPALETKILAAWEEVRRAGAESLVDKRSRARYELAQKRKPLLDELQAIPQGLELNEYDQYILACWQDDLLRKCHEARRWHKDYDEAAKRRDLIERLAEAIKSGDEPTIAEIIAKPCVKNYALPDEWQPAIAQAREKRKTAESLLRALKANHAAAKEKFRKEFDARIIRLYEPLFVPVRERLVEWTQELASDTDRVELGESLGTNILPLGQQSNRVIWSFPSPRFCEECQLGVTRAKPVTTTRPDNCKLEREATIKPDQFEANRGYVLASSSKLRGYHVCVWALIDLGFCKVTSAPVDLGRIKVKTIVAR